MKKLILFVAVAAFGMSFNSCSSDDSGSSTSASVTVKVDGVAKTFDNVVVSEDSETIGGVTFTNLSVVATMGDSTSEYIAFDLVQGVSGADSIYYFEYKTDGVIYHDDNASLTTVVQTSSSSKLKGSFSGTLVGGTATETVVLTDGQFNINY